jgi:hypothetical protein
MANWFERLKRKIFGGSTPTEKKSKSLPSVAEVKKPSARTSAQLARVVIGLDFGTSSTKVVFRKIGEKEAWVAPSPVSHTDFAWFCTPTNVVTIDGVVNLGDLIKPEKRNGEAPLKLQLLDCSDDFGSISDPEKKVIGYLGWILETAFDSVKAQYGVKEFQPILNIGTPVAYFGSKENFQQQFKRYKGVARAALATTQMFGGPGIQNQMDESQYSASVDKAWQKRAKVDLIGVHPESISALVSLLRDPAIEGGVHCVVDIGAGTTEVSTSFLTRGHLACYQDSTERRGIFDYPTGTNVSEKQPAQDLLYKWWRQFEVNWELSRRKDASNPVTHEAWRKSSIMFTGGGGFHPDVRPYFEKRIKADSPANDHFGKGNWSMSIQTYQPSEQALKPARSSQSEGRAAFHLVAVAHGLSFHRREWPAWYRPEEVETMEGPEIDAPPFDPADAGYHGK